MRKKTDKRGVRLAAALGMTACLFWQSPAQAAKSPIAPGAGQEEAGPAEGPALEEEEPDQTSQEAVELSEEELNDSLIEYRELEALIRSGNSSAINAQSSYENSLEVYEAAYSSLVSARRDMLNKADELEDAGGDAGLISSYEQSASALTASARQMKKRIDSLTSVPNQSTLNKTVEGLVKTAQTLMGSYAEMELQRQAAEKRVEEKTAVLELMQGKRQAGLTTDDQLLEAEKNLLSAQTSLLSAQESAESLKRQLAVMIGRDPDEIQTGQIPEVTAEELGALNLEEDREKAIIADSNVKSAKKSSAVGDAQRKLRRQQIAEAEGQASITADELYQTVQTKKLQCDAASAAYQAAVKDYGALQTRYAAGLISRSEYLSGETVYLEQTASYETAKIELRLAVDGYWWDVRKGI